MNEKVIKLKLKCANCGNKQELKMPINYCFYSHNNYLLFSTNNSHIRTNNILTWKTIYCKRCNSNWLEKNEKEVKK